MCQALSWGSESKEEGYQSKCPCFCKVSILVGGDKQEGGNQYTELFQENQMM